MTFTQRKNNCTSILIKFHNYICYLFKIITCWVFHQTVRLLTGVRRRCYVSDQPISHGSKCAVAQLAHISDVITMRVHSHTGYKSTTARLTKWLNDHLHSMQLTGQIHQWNALHQQVPQYHILVVQDDNEHTAPMHATVSTRFISDQLLGTWGVYRKTLEVGGIVYWEGRKLLSCVNDVNEFWL